MILSPILGCLFIAMEGYVLARLILKNEDGRMLLSLSVPLGILLNTLLFFGYTLLHVPLAPLPLFAGHSVMLAALLGTYHGCKHPWPLFFATSNNESKHERLTKKSTILITCCVLLLSAKAVYAFSHAVLLPTAQLDSLANWNMRAKLSFQDRAMAFDTDALRGMEKPHYPFLFHSSQIFINQGQGTWNDSLANGIHFLLALTSFTALWLMLKRISGTIPATVAVTLITGLPLAAAHLGQGYADMMLAQFAALSLGALLLFVRGDKHWLIISALFAAAGVWTKEEGLLFVLVPWVGLLALLWCLHAPRRRWILGAGVTGVITGGLFTLFALLHHFGLTPHGNDASLAANTMAMRALPQALFWTSSLGPVWYMLPVALLALGVAIRRNSPDIDYKNLPTLLWGLSVMVLVFGIYLLTPNAASLLDGTAFYRQMFTPLALIIVSITAILSPAFQRDFSK